VARPWRLRHKLTLGLALVVGSVGLLLAGAMFGLSSYLQTQRTTARKLSEMRLGVELKSDIQRVRESDGQAAPFSDGADGSTGINLEYKRVRGHIATAEETLARYQTLLRSQYPTGSDGSLHEYAQLTQLPAHFEALRAALDRARTSQNAGGVLVNDPQFTAAHAECERLARELITNLLDDVEFSNRQSAADHRRSLLVSGFATALAIVLVGTLLYYFRVWVLTPIRLIQSGVHEVHGGHFDRPIRLESGDELQELADEFNAMTGRLQGTYRDLEAQVNDRTRQLVRSERMVSVGFLAAGVAHEINNPLASIAFCAEALERRLSAALPRLGGEGEVVQKYLRMIQDESQRCKTITQKLLDFSRSGGKRERAELSQLVSDVIDVASVLPNARNKSIRFEPAAMASALVSVPDIKGVVLNLIVNALDSMEEGGAVEVTLAADARQAELRFADSGCGMAPDTLQHIFEPFFTRSRTGNGTGLGLSISHQIVDQHGGTIRATSDGPGRGSTFAVRLPLAPADGRAEPAAAPNPPSVLAFPGRTAAVA
jgi:two-component system NtrC family sensor kinase